MASGQIQDGSTTLENKKSLCILIVDDNRDAANALARLLRLMGHEVRAAYDGQQALPLCIEMRPDLLLLDLGMPGFSGFEACQSIRSYPGFADLRIVAVTGFAHEESRKASAEAGFDEHLVKPVKLDVLEELLDKVTAVSWLASE